MKNTKEELRHLELYLEHLLGNQDKYDWFNMEYVRARINYLKWLKRQ